MAVVLQSKLSYDELAKRLADAETKLAAKTKIHFKVAKCGGVSVYGLNARFPVTLYRQQWERLIQALPELATFINANAAQLSVKAAA